MYFTEWRLSHRGHSNGSFHAVSCALLVFLGTIFFAVTLVVTCGGWDHRHSVIPFSFTFCV